MLAVYDFIPAEAKTYIANVTHSPPVDIGQYQTRPSIMTIHWLLISLRI